MILDIFYNEIVSEASRGNIECYFRYNILFETNILGNQNVADGLEDTNIPVLNIDSSLFILKLCINSSALSAKNAIVLPVLKP